MVTESFCATVGHICLREDTFSIAQDALIGTFACGAVACCSADTFLSAKIGVVGILMITLSSGSAEFHICAGIDASVIAKDVSFRANTLTIGTHRTALAGLSFEIGVVSIFSVTCPLAPQ